MGEDDEAWVPPVSPREGRMEPSLVPEAGDYHVTRHRPSRFREPFHHHASVELNYLHGAAMQYAFGARTVEVPAETLTLFWALMPHRVTGVEGGGAITALYLPLSSLMGRTRHKRLLDALLRGEVLAARAPTPGDAGWLDRLVAEAGDRSPAWTEQHLAEIDARLGRFALEGWRTLSRPHAGEPAPDLTQRAIRQVEVMMSEIAERFDWKVSVAEIAARVNLSEGHAAELFRRITGRTIKAQLTEMRLAQARMLLLQTDLKMATVAHDSGFGSVSSFYEAFVREAGITPLRYRRSRGALG